MATGRPGLQHERTSLSWSRTALAALALAATSIKAGLARDDPAALVSGALALLAAAICYAGGHLHAVRSPAARAPLLRLLSGVALAAASAAAVSIARGLLGSG